MRLSPYNLPAQAMLSPATAARLGATPTASASPFDASAWLEAFASDGGSYAITGDGRLWLGVIDVAGMIDSHTIHLVGHPERVEAIKAVVKKRCLIG